MTTGGGGKPCYMGSFVAKCCQGTRDMETNHCQDAILIKPYMYILCEL